MGVLEAVHDASDSVLDLVRLDLAPVGSNLKDVSFHSDRNHAIVGHHLVANDVNLLSAEVGEDKLRTVASWTVINSPAPQLRGCLWRALPGLPYSSGHVQ